MSNKCRGKVCAEGKECNPLTGRCIIKRRKAKSCADKKCPEGKECNPKTIRCIKKKQINKKNDKDKMVSKQIMDSTSNDKLYFYSKSADKAPGKGANEFVQDASLYTQLNNIKDWRKVLSNFHMCPFKYDGHTYNTIEHVFQGKKIELADKEKGLLFTLESGHEIGKGDGEIARKHRKLIKLSPELLQKWGQMRDKVMHDASVAKYKACPEAQAVLKATNSAQLWHVVPRSKPVRFEHLEEIRNEM
jgi:predicted NAD-dependent protein-ADP-ribosyltransferase YbiA (DUF1768 family)